MAHYGLRRLLLWLARLDNPCLSIVKVKGIFHLIEFHLKLAYHPILLHLLRLLPSKLLLHLLVLRLQLSLHLESLLHLRQLLLQLVCLHITLRLPLVIHQQAQALRIKLIGLIPYNLLQDISYRRLLLLFLHKALIHPIFRQKQTYSLQSQLCLFKAIVLRQLLQRTIHSIILGLGLSGVDCSAKHRGRRDGYIVKQKVAGRRTVPFRTVLVVLHQRRVRVGSGTPTERRPLLTACLLSIDTVLLVELGGRL